MVDFSLWSSVDKGAVTDELLRDYLRNGQTLSAPSSRQAAANDVLARSRVPDEACEEDARTVR